MSTSRQKYPARVLATDPRRIEQSNDWAEYDAQLLERNGNLAYVEFSDGHAEWLAPHEWRHA